MPTSPATLTADHVLYATQHLPAWDPTKDDDPVWLRSPSAVGLTPVDDLADPAIRAHLIRARDLATDHRILAPATPVLLDAIVWTTQSWVRLDALAHYLRTDRLFDPDGWFGTDFPVLAVLPDDRPGYVIMDGNNRIGAARLRGNRTILAHVVDPGPSPV